MTNDCVKAPSIVYNPVWPKTPVISFPEAVMTDKIVALCTCASAEEAAKIARHLVENRLAACVTIFPHVRSIYRWKGVVEDATEWLLMVKSRRGLVERLSAEIASLHSYQVPEVVALPLVDGSPAYLNWLDRELSHEE
jgi:periplasmic divalent cation tolerance protein